MQWSVKYNVGNTLVMYTSVSTFLTQVQYLSKYT